jgi:hypothetical protein
MNKCYNIIHENEEQDEGFYGRIWGMVACCKGIFYKVVGEESDSP